MRLQSECQPPYEIRDAREGREGRARAVFGGTCVVVGVAECTLTKKYDKYGETCAVLTMANA